MSNKIVDLHGTPLAEGDYVIHRNHKVMYQIERIYHPPRDSWPILLRCPSHLLQENHHGLQSLYSNGDWVYRYPDGLPLTSDAINFFIQLSQITKVPTGY